MEGRGDSIRLGVHVEPRASCSEVVGTHGAALKVRLHVDPVGGSANDLMETNER